MNYEHLAEYKWLFLFQTVNKTFKSRGNFIGMKDIEKCCFILYILSIEHSSNERRGG